MGNQSKWRRLPTEAINPATRDIDTLPVPAIVDVMISDSKLAIEAVERERQTIGVAAELFADAVRNNGRLIFVGAGTSGRLGVLEAAEMPPTFGISSSAVHAVMAGGKSAVHRAKEGVEDGGGEGSRVGAGLKPSARDVVVGVSASGVPPFVRGALIRARRDRARTVGITCDPESAMRGFADVVISLPTGPEVVAGSTRLKAGTATKVVLNILTTAAMIRAGKTYGNLMVDVQSNSAKLRDRGRRIIAAATALGDDDAAALLRRAKGNVKAAIVMQKAGLTLPRALQRLRDARGSVREAIREE